MSPRGLSDDLASSSLAFAVAFHDSAAFTGFAYYRIFLGCNLAARFLFSSRTGANPHCLSAHREIPPAV